MVFRNFIYSHRNSDQIYLEPSGYTWNHRDILGTKAFLLTLLYIIGMIIVQAGELLSTSLRGMTAYANLYYRFIQYAPVCCLLLCLQSTGKFRLRIRKSLQLYPQFCLISSTQKYRTDIRLRWRTRQPAE